jgi:hypothetical protein
LPYSIYRFYTTKNFADGCSSHIKDGVFATGNVALPDHGAFLIENTLFSGDVKLEANHHCAIGTTGDLCMPTYVFIGATWKATGANYMYFQPGNNKGGIFTLSPPEQANPSGNIFPSGYCSLVSNFFTYLLKHDGGKTCKFASDATRYGNGILCNKPVRSIRIYTRGLTTGSAKKIRIRIYTAAGNLVETFAMPFHETTSEKQGYAFPVIAAFDAADHTWDLSVEGGADGGKFPAGT